MLALTRLKLWAKTVKTETPIIQMGRTSLSSSSHSNAHFFATKSFSAWLEHVFLFSGHKKRANNKFTFSAEISFHKLATCTEAELWPKKMEVLLSQICLFFSKMFFLNSTFASKNYVLQKISKLRFLLIKQYTCFSLVRSTWWAYLKNILQNVKCINPFTSSN